MMTTPLIEMPMAIELATTAETAILPETAKANGDSLQQLPSPEAVTRFQMALAEPLAANARAGRAMADSLPLTQTPLAPVALKEMPQQQISVVERSVAPSLGEGLEKASAPSEGEVRVPSIPAEKEQTVSVDLKPTVDAGAKEIKEFPPPGRELKTDVEVQSEAASKSVQEKPIAQVSTVRGQPVFETSLPPSIDKISMVVSGEVVSELVATDCPPRVAQATGEGRGEDVGCKSVEGKPQVVVPREVDRGSGLDLARGIVVVDESSQAGMPSESFQMGKPVEQPGTDKPVELLRTDKPVELLRTDKPVELLRTDKPVEPSRTGLPIEPSRTGMPVEPPQTGMPIESPRADRSVEPPQTGRPFKPTRMEGAVDLPDAERLVAAGIRPFSVSSLSHSDDVSVKKDEAVAPIAALSAKDRVVRTDVLVEAATAVADALLVSPGLMRGEGEILVQLKPDVLEGSQIRISVQGQIVGVAFKTPTELLTQMLTTRLPELQQHLMSALPTFNFKVSVGQGGGRWTARKDAV